MVLDPAHDQAGRSSAPDDLHAEALDNDMYAAIDALADKIDRQLVKHKEKAQARAQGAGVR